MLSSNSTTQFYRVVLRRLDQRTLKRRPFGTSRNRNQHWPGNLNYPAIKGALIGGGGVSLGWYAWYSVASATPIIQKSEQTQSYLNLGADQLKSQFREITPGPTDEVIKALREVADKYSAWIPDGRGFVEASFRDIERVREKYEDEVNEIVRDTYEELRDITNRRGASLEIIDPTWYVLSRRLEELSSLSGDGAQRILDSYPELRGNLDASFESLRQLGDRLGPGAKSEVDETFAKVAQIAKQGHDDDIPVRITRLVQDKALQIKARSEQTWAMSWEQIQPLLERNPKVKKISEENVETLKQGRAKEAVEKVQQAVLSGSSGELERYIKDLSKKAAQNASGSLLKWLSRVPDGSRILPQLQKMKEVADTRSAKAEQLARDTLIDVSRLLDERARKAEEILRSPSTRHDTTMTGWVQ